MSRPKTNEPQDIYLDSSCGPFRSSFVIFLMSLDLYSRYFSNGIDNVII
jgi:hypothetical protein